MDGFGVRRRPGAAERDRRGGAGKGRMAGDKIQRGVLAVAIVLLVSMIAVAVALGATTGDAGAGVTAFVLFAAASAVGAALGFLFGLPRARVGDLASDGTAADPAPPTPPKASTFYLTNSNLIKVSDWLTTIVIGLGLVNLGKVGPAVRDLGHALQAPLGRAAYSGAVGVSVLVVGVLAGFILDYLWTSIRVRELLEEAERQNQQHVPELRNRTVAQAREQADAKDLKLVVPPGTPDDATVVEQTLPPGTPVPRGTGLTVTMLATTPTPGTPPAPATPAPPAVAPPSARAAGVPGGPTVEGPTGDGQVPAGVGPAGSAPAGPAPASPAPLEAAAEGPTSAPVHPTPVEPAATNGPTEDAATHEVTTADLRASVDDEATQVIPTARDRRP